MKSLQKNFLYNVLYQILLVILPLITAPYISRTLGATAVGVYSYTYSVAYYFLLIAMLGIGNHGNRSIAAVRDDRKKLNKTFSSIYSLQVITFSIAILAYAIYLVLFVKDNRLIVLLQLIYVTSGLFDIGWLFFGLEQFKLTVARNTLIKISTVVLMFVFVHKPSDLWKYTLIMSAGTLFSQAYLWLYVKKYVSFEKCSVKEITSNIKPVLILFIPVLAYSIYKVMDKIMLGNMSSYDQVGFYNNAEKIINIPMGIITALGTVMLPRMSNIVANGDKKRVDDYIRISAKLVTLLSSAIAFGLMGVSSVLAPVFFGDEFIACGEIIRLLSVTVFFIAWANVIRTQYLIPNKRDSIYLTSNGNSLFLIHTNRGEELFEKIQSELDYRSSNTTQCWQANLEAPTQKSEQREEFWNDYKKKGIDFVMKKYGSVPVKTKIKNKLLKIMGGGTQKVVPIMLITPKGGQHNELEAA